MSEFAKIFPTLLMLSVFQYANNVLAQGMGTDPHLCGGYLRDTRGYIDFQFNENTAPPDVATENKFCMWTISPSAPSQYYAYDLTLRNVHLNCNADKDIITLTYFNETNTNPAEVTPIHRESVCISPSETRTWDTWNGTVIVVVLRVDVIQFGSGFYLEWKERNYGLISPPGVRNTYYSFGRPSIDPLPYFAAGFFSNEISTFGFIKANYSVGYSLELQFTEISMCEGQNEWMKCFSNTVDAYAIEDNGQLGLLKRYNESQTGGFEPIKNKNGIFIMVKIQDLPQAGGRFTLTYDTVRG